MREGGWEGHLNWMALLKSFNFNIPKSGTKSDVDRVDFR